MKNNMQTNFFKTAYHRATTHLTPDPSPKGKGGFLPLLRGGSGWGLGRLLFVLLISLPFGEGWGGAVLSAQNGVTISTLAVTAGAAGTSSTVTFDVNWSKEAMEGLKLDLWRDSVWVFVDYNKAGAMERLLLLPGGATLTATSAPGVGEVVEEPGNDQGVWVVGNAKTADSGSFSATVQLLTDVNNVGGACVYGSNYPPVWKYNDATTIAFIGTSPYDLILDCGNPDPDSYSANSTYILEPGCTLTSFTDATGAPGMFLCNLSPGKIGGEEMP
jgi:hypothetical protein